MGGKNAPDNHQSSVLCTEGFVQQQRVCLHSKALSWTTETLSESLPTLFDDLVLTSLS